MRSRTELYLNVWPMSIPRFCVPEMARQLVGRVFDFLETSSVLHASLQARGALVYGRNRNCMILFHSRSVDVEVVVAYLAGTGFDVFLCVWRPPAHRRMGGNCDVIGT
jgi:hypothetical protein